MMGDRIAEAVYKFIAHYGKTPELVIFGRETRSKLLAECRRGEYELKVETFMGIKVLIDPSMAEGKFRLIVVGRSWDE